MLEVPEQFVDDKDQSSKAFAHTRLATLEANNRHQEQLNRAN